MLSLGILRYLGGRFPETTLAVDENGRTALHYGATIKDNGHFYNMLVQMGANPKAIDKVNSCFRLYCNEQLTANYNGVRCFAFQTGHTAEFYLNHDEAHTILSHAELLKKFGANENLADDMLNDQGLGSI